MSVEIGFWSKLSRFVSVLIVLTVLVGIGLWYLPLIQQNERMRQLDLELQDQIEKQKAINEELKQSIEALQNDERAIERTVRERLGYAKPGEIVIRFETNSPPSSSGP